VSSSRILRPPRNGMLCIMVTPQTALRARKANSRIPRGLDLVQNTRRVHVLVPVIVPSLMETSPNKIHQIVNPFHGHHNNLNKELNTGRVRSGQFREERRTERRTEQKKRTIYSGCMSEALMGVWRVTSPLQAEQTNEKRILLIDGGARDLTEKLHKIAPTSGISGFQLPERTAKHSAVH
ncbi:hypothetical protein X777_04269, partial [Ooceraea biroi]